MPTEPSKQLEIFDNPHPERDYIIEISSPEFTCLCPKTGQPDFAEMQLYYVPDRKCVELKSLKLYYWSYRNEGAFHEAVSNTILNDLVAATEPRYMRLRAKFFVRGGIYTTVEVEYRQPGWTPGAPPPTQLPQEIQELPANADMSQAPEPEPDIETPKIRDDAVFLGIDIGTTGCRVVAIDIQGQQLAQANAPIPPPVRNDKQITQDPGEWWKALTACLTTLFQQIDPQRVQAMAVDGTSGTLLLSDKNGKPVIPAMMYNDSRAFEQAQQLAQLVENANGCLGSSSSLAKLLWLQSKQLDKKAALLLHQSDWINGMLTGQWGHSDVNNCLKLGYDPENQCWPQWFDQLQINTELLPQVHAPGTPLGRIRDELAASFGMDPETEVIAGTTDGVAAFLAAGVQQPGEGVTSLGSTLVLKLLSDKAVFSAEHGVYSHKLGRYWLAGGASNSGGAVLLQYFKPEQMNDMSLMLDTDHFTDLDYYPLPSVGERFPVYDPEMEARLEPLPGDSVTFFQGMLEGIARIEAQGYALLSELGAPSLLNVRTTGGGSHNPAWTRLRSKILGVEILKAHSDLAAYGSALLAQGVIAKSYK